LLGLFILRTETSSQSGFEAAKVVAPSRPGRTAEQSAGAAVMRDGAQAATGVQQRQKEDDPSPKAEKAAKARALRWMSYAHPSVAHRILATYQPNLQQSRV